MASGQTFARKWMPVAASVVAGLMVIAGAYAYVKLRLDRSDCVPLSVLSSTEKDELIVDLADRYNDSRRRYDGECAEITVSGLNSGQAMEAFAAADWAAVAGAKVPKPQVWLPTSSLWTDQLALRDQEAGKTARTPGPYESVANSPLVIAMPESKGRFLQQKGPLGWGDILGMSGDQGWATFGRPEWGRFTFGKDNPNLSTSGLAATIATYYAATNTSSDLTSADVQGAATTQFVRRIEANVSHYSDDVVDLLKSLAAADLDTDASAPASDISAIVMQEELVYLYNKGELSPTKGQQPNEPLVALYPKEGTFNLDHPYVTMPDATGAQQRAAADFLAFLQDDAQQRAFAAIGFRDHDQSASADLVAVVGGPQPASLGYFDPPAPGVVEGILASWQTLRKKANILMALDISGSMKTNKIGNLTRFQVAIGAAKNGIQLLNSEDRVGLWTFSSEPVGSGGQPYTEQIPLGGLVVDRFNSRLDTLKERGETALYATTRAAYRHMQASYDPTRINAVVVLTDGRNEYPRDEDLAKLLADIALDPKRPVKVFCIAFDVDSDLETLEKIAKASAGKAFNAKDPELIDEAFVKLLSSF
jgi:Ca-activated chloride channel homolog